MSGFAARVCIAVIAFVLTLTSAAGAQPPAIPQPGPSDVPKVQPDNRNPAPLSQRIAQFNAKVTGFVSRAAAHRGWETTLRAQESSLAARSSALDAESRALEARRPSPYASAGVIAQFNNQVDAYNAKVIALNADVDNHNRDVDAYNAEREALVALQQELLREAEAIDAETTRVEAEAQRASAPPRAAPQPGNQPQRQPQSGVNAPQPPAAGNSPSRQQQTGAVRKYEQDKGVRVVEKPVTARLTPETLDGLSEQQVAQLTGGGQRQFDALVPKPGGKYIGIVVRGSAGPSPSEAAFESAIERGGQAKGSLDGNEIIIDEVEVIQPPQLPAPTPETRTLPAAPPDPARKPTGRPQVIKTTDDEATQRSLERENDSAEILARAGYEVEQQPNVPGTTKNPDYRINGRIFDNYAPSTSNPRNILDGEVRKKVERGQATRIVVNLADSDVTLDALRTQLRDWPIPGLEEIIIIGKDKSIIHFFPW
ncbi:hypothetical protein [Nocardia sp. NPDC052112]|uniref:CdiA C-terminal domain-containing protein n=1 Tax=Nocardia sp. NPDC052112 TaxID=3155646 RepID=UPI00342B8253